MELSETRNFLVSSYFRNLLGGNIQQVLVYLDLLVPSCQAVWCQDRIMNLRVNQPWKGL